jgi:DNA repair exonuclease SbcCD nuclease subunit
MRLLLIGDLHVKCSNLTDIDLFISKVDAHIDSVVYDGVVLMGDLLDTHERIHTTPLNKIYDFIDILRTRTTVYIIVGNHDMINNKIFLTDHHWMNGLKKWENVVVVDKVEYMRFETDGRSEFITMAPYVFPGRFVEALNTGEMDWKESTCVFAHQEFKGCKMGAIISEVGDEWESAWPPVFSGHIHSKQQVGTNVFYTGSAIQHAFGESKENVLMDLTIHSKGNIKVQEIDFLLPRKRIEYTDACDFENAYRRLDSKLARTRDHIKLTVTGSMAEIKALKKSACYKKILEKGVKVSFKLDKQQEVIVEGGHENDFKRKLHETVHSTKDKYLIDVYNEMFSFHN